MNQKLDLIKKEIEKCIVGKEECIDCILLSLLVGGHVLLEDVPGVGKTTLVKALAKSIDLNFKRIQFTPDVMPSDLTGFEYYNKEVGSFEYHPGSFHQANIILADELNRTTGKTQSALLEAMAENQVTVNEKTYSLDNPFIVYATQNEVDNYGSKELSLAQKDRFAMSLSIGYPSIEDEIELLKNRKKNNPLENVQCVCSKKELMQMQEEVKNTTVAENIYIYIANLVATTRSSNLLRVGLSPRASIELVELACAHAYLMDRSYATPEDVRSVFLKAAKHRVLLSQFAIVNKKKEDDVLEDILHEVTAPDEPKKNH